MRLRNLILFLAVFALTFACWAAIGQPAAATAGFCAYQVPLFPIPAGAPDPVAGVSFDTATLGTADWNGAGGNLATLCAEWVPTYYGTVPPATCEPPLVFFDTDAVAGENLFLCASTNTWTQIAGGGGGADLTVEEADGAPTVASVARIQFDQADGFSVVDETGGQVQVDFALPAATVTPARMADADHGDVSWLAGVATVEGLQFGTAFPVSPATGDVFAVTDDSTVGACDSAGGAARTFCTWDGAAWVSLGDGIETGVVVGSDSLLLHVREEQPAGTDGGDGTSLVWNTRTLNTTKINDIPGASLAANRVTLPPGTYRLFALAPSFRVARNRLRIRDITGASTLAVGPSNMAGTSSTDAGDGFVTAEGVVTLSVTSEIEVQHWLQDATLVAGTDFGVATGAVGTPGEVEVYAELFVEQLGAGLAAGARASRSTTQAIATATWTAVTMDAESWDDGGVFDLATQPTRLSVPAGSGGRWLVVGEVEWSATGSATAVEAAIRQTGVEVAAVRAEDFASSGRQVSAVVDAAAGDYFELFVRQDSGVSDDVASAWVAAWCLSCGPSGAGGSGGGGSPDGASAIVRVEKSAAQSIAAGGFTTLTWQTEIEDASGWRDPGTPNRLTVPTGYDGDYTVGCMASHATTTGTTVSGILQVTVNGVPEGRGAHRSPTASAGTISATTAVNLAAGDYVECEFSHDDSAALDVLQCGGNNCATGAPTQLWVRRGGGTNDHGTLGGLADDDHPQYVLDAGDTMTGPLTLTAQAPPAHTSGQLFFDSGADALSFHNSEVDVALQVGQESWIRVRNETGSTITNGSAVYINGNHAGTGLPTIALARADAVTTAGVVGLATHSIENNTTGFVTELGTVRGLDTSAYSNKDQLWLSAATPGALTATEPTAPNFAVPVGWVTKAAAGTAGSIAVAGNSTAKIEQRARDQFVDIAESPAAGDIIGSHSTGYTVVSGAVGVTELGDDATCGANEVVARNATDTAFECQASSGGASSAGTGLQYGDGAGGFSEVTSSGVSGDDVTIGGDLGVGGAPSPPFAGPTMHILADGESFPQLRIQRAAGGSKTAVDYQTYISSTGRLILGGVMTLAKSTSRVGINTDPGSWTLYALGDSRVGGMLHVDGQQINAPLGQTCADSGDANPGFLAVTVSGRTFAKLTNADADGCTATLSETNATDGQRLEVVNVSNAGGTLSLADSAGVQETGAGCSLAAWGSATFRYTTDRWVLTSCEPTN